MRATTLEKLLKYSDDKELLDIYNELESGKVPNTSYAHDFCRKVNRMVDDGELSVGDGGYRHIYLPTLRRALYKELASRYATYLHNYKAPAAPVEAPDCYGYEDIRKCEWCNGEYYEGDLRRTDMGMLCETCIEAIRSRGEDICIVT